MLAAFGDRAPNQVDDVVGSLELTWLLAEIEQRYGVVVDLDADDMGAIQTVADATRVLGRAVAAAEPEAGGTVGAVAGADEGPAPA
ncbi:acyl carrier protein [Streptomyces sp. KK5PA1]|uniref:Acyl carrier protein n=2 Tax=Actinacidiphila acididurans TaxID=2784346 RepID=A0ABS2U5T1_9ACTN|nr:acyl carrier protein [Actinacidiphila acididurans]